MLSELLPTLPSRGNQREELKELELGLHEAGGKMENGHSRKKIPASQGEPRLFSVFLPSKRTLYSVLFSLC